MLILHCYVLCRYKWQHNNMHVYACLLLHIIYFISLCILEICIICGCFNCFMVLLYINNVEYGEIYALATCKIYSNQWRITMASCHPVRVSRVHYGASWCCLRRHTMIDWLIMVCRLGTTTHHTVHVFIVVHNGELMAAIRHSTRHHGVWWHPIRHHGVWFSVTRHHGVYHGAKWQTIVSTWHTMVFHNNYQGSKWWTLVIMAPK